MDGRGMGAKEQASRGFEFRTRHPMGERDSSRKILAFIPFPPFLCLHPRIQDKQSKP